MLPSLEGKKSSFYSLTWVLRVAKLIREKSVFYDGKNINKRIDSQEGTTQWLIFEWFFKISVLFTFKSKNHSVQRNNLQHRKGYQHRYWFY